MALVLIGAEGSVTQKLLSFARMDKRDVVPIYHRNVPLEFRDDGGVAIDTTASKDIAAVVKEGDTVVVTLADYSDLGAALTTPRLHAVLAGILGRNVRFVVLDTFLPDMIQYQISRQNPSRRHHQRFRQFRWADDIKTFAKQNGTPVSVLRTGPIYGAAPGVLLDVSFWREIMSGGSVASPLPADTRQDFVALEEAAHAFYLLASDTEPYVDLIEELHMPRQDPISISELIVLGSQAAGTTAFARKSVSNLWFSLGGWFGKTQHPEPNSVLTEGAMGALAAAFSERFGLVRMSHEINVQNTIASLRKLAK